MANPISEQQKLGTSILFLIGVFSLGLDIALAGSLRQFVGFALLPAVLIIFAIRQVNDCRWSDECDQVEKDTEEEEHW